VSPLSAQVLEVEGRNVANRKARHEPLHRLRIEVELADSHAEIFASAANSAKSFLTLIIGSNDFPSCMADYRMIPRIERRVASPPVEGIGRFVDRFKSVELMIPWTA
jgi:hypothetical protein